jgi:L-ribulose-5-phosphate 4-epimerase
MSRFQAQRQTVLDAALQMVARSLVVGTAGNISLRLPGKRPLLAITPTSQPYDTLSADDIPIIDFNGRKVEGTLGPSMETGLHIAIYRARQDINAIIHNHSVYASAVAVAGLEIPPILEDQVAYLGGAIKLAAYAPSGTKALTDAVVKALGERSGVLLAHHGALGIGRTMRDAFTACEIIEKTARIYLLALGVGKVRRLPADGIKAMKAIYDKR